MKRRGPRFSPSPKQVREAYADAVNPDLAVQPVMRLSEMSPEKIAELEKLYGAKVAPRAAPVPRPPPEKVKFPHVEGEKTDYHPKCPNKSCDAFLKLRAGKFGLFYGCQRYPNCKTTWAAYDDGRTKGEPKIR